MISVGWLQGERRSVAQDPPTLEVGFSLRGQRSVVLPTCFHVRLMPAFSQALGSSKSEMAEHPWVLPTQLQTWALPCFGRLLSHRE